MPNGRISVVLPTYEGDVASYLSEAIESLVTQSRKPDEILVVQDGPIPADNKEILSEFSDNHESIRILPFDENRGRAVARREGVRESNGELIAMMDADDIALDGRLERQEKFLRDNPEVDVVGGELLEIEPETGEAIAIRTLPESHEELSEMAKSRSPLSQSTVMARREAILSAGNYRNVDRMEDYDLWVRMLVDGASFANLPEPLAKARTGSGMYDRRGGWEYARQELRLQRDFLRWGFISLPQAGYNLLTRFPIRLVPSTIRKIAYKKLFRNTS